MLSLASRCSLILILASQATTAWADTLRVAVATNFSRTATLLAEQFEQQTGHTIRLAFGSTGKHFAQISHGAPFDLFLAADAERPALLEKNAIAVPDSRFTYAQGRLLLWSPDAGLIDADAAVLETGAFRKLAIANPRLAPYGRAAREVLQARGLWDRLQPQLVRGENIGQSYQYVHSGNAQLGFVAAAQVFAKPVKKPPVVGSYWEPPQSLYTPIIQQAVLIRDTPLARAFIDFLHSEAAREIIRRHGYHTPEVDTAVPAE
ncbi:MAG: molybdate ABC transporter substrate-binding protein [Gammaproteobacteria bacterium]|nr:molybdate ABC transporter substrate-binding protein [Gammaproteobacteria bacterium]